MSPNVAYFVFAAFAGAMLPTQAAINARLARAVGGPAWAATISALVLAAALGAIAYAATRALPRLAAAAALPWWAWTGGLCGAVVLGTTTAAAPKIGAAPMIALVMAGQVLASLALDATGAFGLAVQPASPTRLLAALLLLAGAALISAGR